MSVLLSWHEKVRQAKPKRNGTDDGTDVETDRRPRTGFERA